MADTLPYRYIAIDGPIGVGKTTLVDLIARRFEAVRVLEDVNNPFLADFYQDRPGAAFQTQLYFILQRFQQQQETVQRELFQKLLVADYCFQKDRIFAYLTLSDDELMLYEKLYSTLEPQVPSPDLVIYLTADVTTCMARIRRRQRSFERFSRSICLLIDAYNHFFHYYNCSPPLVVDTRHLNFPSAEDFEELLLQLQRPIKGRSTAAKRGAAPPAHWPPEANGLSGSPGDRGRWRTTGGLRNASAPARRCASRNAAASSASAVYRCGRSRRARAQAEPAALAGFEIGRAPTAPRARARRPTCAPGDLDERSRRSGGLPRRPPELALDRSRARRTAARLRDRLHRRRAAAGGGGGEEERALAANLIWSAKEAALKVLRTGLRRSTLSVEVRLDAGPPREGWSPLAVGLREGGELPGWWRRAGAFVLAVAADRPFAPPVSLRVPPGLDTARPAEAWRARLAACGGCR